MIILADQEEDMGIYPQYLAWGGVCNQIPNVVHNDLLRTYFENNLTLFSNTFCTLDFTKKTG